MKYFAGIDIGGTNTTVGIVNNIGEVINTTNYNTHKYLTAQDLVNDIGHELIEIRKVLAIEGIGIGAPNGNYNTGSIEYAHNMPWEGIIPLAEMFSKKTGLNCKLTNDANAAAMGEMKFGGAKGMKNFLMVTLGTGVGAGIVIGGEIVLGHNGFAGEVGHIIIRPNGRLCGCGRTGCIEAYCSASGIMETYFKISNKEKIINLSLTAIANLAKNGDVDALKTFDITGRILGLALANLVAFTSPEAIFLFGGPTQNGEIILDRIKKHFTNNLLHLFKGKINIFQSQLPLNYAAILGAASLVSYKN